MSEKERVGGKEKAIKTLRVRGKKVRAELQEEDEEDELKREKKKSNRSLNLTPKCHWYTPPEAFYLFPLPLRPSLPPSPERGLTPEVASRFLL